MPDIGERYTDEALEALRRRLRSVYTETRRDIALKLSSFERAHRERVIKHRIEVEEGKITQADFDAWMRGQVFQREQWQQKQRQIAEIMTHVDEQAMAMLNDGKVDVFGENANFMGWQLESGAGTDFGFGLYNHDAVTRLIRDDPDLLPRPGIDKEKDYAWYNRIVSDAVTQGILQGEALDEIMLRIANDTGERSINAMLRNARTAYTGAQNAGREMAMRRVAAKGIRVEKQWSAFMDGVTRDAHAKLNGKHVPPDEYFESMLGKIRYPADPDAKAANVYNCRCCLKKYFPDYLDSSGVRGGSGEDTDENRAAYERWKLMKRAGKTVQDVRKWLKNREKDAKKARTSEGDPLAGATWANGPYAGQKYGQEMGKALTGSAGDGTINAGALNGFSKRAEKHAIQYYESVRHMNTDIMRIAENTGWSAEDIQSVKDHVFFKEHDLGDRIGRFDPSYYIAQSWQRLIQGNGEIREQDIVLLNHELLEEKYEQAGMTYEQAHAEAEKQFDYSKYIPKEDLSEW